MQFREGVKRVCGLELWKHFASWFGMDAVDQNVTALAKQLHISHPVVSKGLGEGRLSLELLVTTLADADRQYVDLGERPTRKTLFIGGYRRALEYVRRKILSKNDALRQLRAHAFLALCSYLKVLAGREESELLDVEKWEDDKKRNVARRVRVETAVLLSGETNIANYSSERLWELVTEHGVPDYTFEDLQSLRSEWGAEADRCFNAIPIEWWTWLEKKDADGE